MVRNTPIVMPRHWNELKRLEAKRHENELKAETNKI